MDAEGGTGEVSRRACISGTDGSACCLPDVLAGNVVLKGLRLINRAYREDIVISSASPIYSEGMGGVIDKQNSFHTVWALLGGYLYFDHVFDTTVPDSNDCVIQKSTILVYHQHSPIFSKSILKHIPAGPSDYGYTGQEP